MSSPMNKNELLEQSKIKFNRFLEKTCLITQVKI